MAELAISTDKPDVESRRIAPAALFWSGVASGVGLEVLLSAAALATPSHGRALLVLLIAINILFLIRCLWRQPPPAVTAAYALARGLDWALSMALALLALLLVFHAQTPIRALAGTGVALMLVLWSAAVRRLTLAPAPR